MDGRPYCRNKAAFLFIFFRRTVVWSESKCRGTCTSDTFVTSFLSGNIRLSL